MSRSRRIRLPGQACQHGTAFDDSTALPVGRGIMTKDPINILLVDDQPAKLLCYEATLQSLGENLIKAGSAREALEHLLKEDIAIVLSDVCMPELDGFELARMIRHHPRFQHTAILCRRAHRPRPYQRVQLRGGRLRASAGRPRITSGQGTGVCRSL